MEQKEKKCVSRYIEISESIRKNYRAIKHDVRVFGTDHGTGTIDFWKLKKWERHYDITVLIKISALTSTIVIIFTFVKDRDYAIAVVPLPSVSLVFLETSVVAETTWWTCKRDCGFTRSVKSRVLSCPRAKQEKRLGNYLVNRKVVPVSCDRKKSYRCNVRASFWKWKMGNRRFREDHRW